MAEVHESPQIRTPDQRLRVFISSTMKELAAERAAVHEAVRALRLTPILFEEGARPHPPRDLYRAYLDQSDIFVGIYARQYGWVAPDMEISGIEDEYLLAGDKPRLIYVRGEAERDDRLQDLLGRIADTGGVSYKRFETAEELRELVGDDLSLLITERFQGPHSGAAAAEAAPAINLPAYASSLIGRERELAAVRSLLVGERARLVTLTGPGGTGKTRLAVEAARGIADRFANGVSLVTLDSVRDASLFAPALASALGVHEFGSVRLLDTIKAQMRGRRMLLVLDNLEQIIDAAAEVAELVRDLPELSVLATSREPLRVSAEREFPVSPLDTKAADGAEADAVRLFVERAQAVRPDFSLSTGNRGPVEEICRRLDGLPLAIELAAARVRMLNAAAIRDRLAEGAEILEGGARDLPERQRTMRATIAWSYDLLTHEEKATFRRLGVFAGGFTLSAAAEVCGHVAAGVDTLDVLGSLTTKSLLRVEDALDDEPRLTMLGSIRDFAAGQLNEEALREARDAHCRYFADFSRSHELTLISPEAGRYRSVFEREYPNLRQALQHATERVAGPDFDPELLVSLLYFVYFFWYMSGRLTEGRELSAHAVSATEGMSGSPARAASLFALGVMTLWQGDFAQAARLGEESLTIWRRYEDRPHDVAIAHLVPCLTGLNMGDTEMARPAFEECLRLLRQTDDEATRVIILLHLGDVELREGDREAAHRLYEEGMALQERLGPGWPVAALENDLGELARYGGDHEAAEDHYRTALEWFQQLDSPGNIARTEHNLGYVELRRGNLDEAEGLFRSALATFRSLGNRRGTAECLQALGAAAAGSGDATSAARLMGASEALLGELSARAWPADERERERDWDTIVRSLGKQAAESEHALGGKIVHEQGVDEMIRQAGI